ncbi:unnamed protein product [Soboliphyme baturini]|uniref:Aa_trans domain-containing protein n=1 Tax=Soboliphyme baturini TaxID=241478 RepID=A0A183IIP4_9BILA|nr:unnamed protein product [Soboliphyme baturini]
MSSPESQRTRAISIATAFMTTGMIAGPGVHLGPVYMNMYTVPSIILMIAFMTSFALILTSFYEYVEYKELEEHSNAAEKTKMQCRVSAFVVAGSRFDVVPKFNVYATMILCFCWFSTFFTVTNMETLSSPYAMIIFNWTRKQTTVYTSLLMGISAMFSILMYSFYIWKGNKFSSLIFYKQFKLVYLCRIENRKSIIFGICMQLIYFLLTYPYPTWKSRIHYFKKAGIID